AGLPLVVAVGVVEPRPVETLLDHPPKHGRVPRGRAQGAEDPGAPGRAHASTPSAVGASHRTAFGGAGTGAASGWRSAARISTPSTRRGPGRVEYDGRATATTRPPATR